MIRSLPPHCVRCPRLRFAPSRLERVRPDQDADARRSRPGDGLRAPARLRQARDQGQDVDRRARAAVAHGQSRPDEGDAEAGDDGHRRRLREPRAIPRRCAPSASSSPARRSSSARALAAMASAIHSVEASGLGRFMREALYAYPVAETVHIAGIALLFGSIAIVDLRLLGLGKRIPLGAAGRVRRALVARRVRDRRLGRAC